MGPADEVFLHAGFHKTGTTSFQALLAANRARLPVALVNHTDAGVRRLRAAVYAYRPDRDAATGPAVAAAVGALAAPHPGRLLVSSEFLTGPVPAPKRSGPVYGTAADLLRWAREGLGGRPVAVWLSTRDRDLWLTSLFRHLLASRGLRLSEAAFRALPGFAAFTWEGVIADIRSRFGPVEVFAMEAGLDPRLGPGTAMLARLGLDAAALAAWEPAGRRNAGLSEGTARAMERPLALVLPAIVRKYVARTLDRDTRRRRAVPRPL
ncbi:MAG: hypothetical protein IT545_13660 [Rhodobacteraceae bacterium]|nr:hypothetical protein [Paracoccaceae bacterium]